MATLYITSIFTGITSLSTSCHHIYVSKTAGIHYLVYYSSVKRTYKYCQIDEKMYIALHEQADFKERLNEKRPFCVNNESEIYDLIKYYTSTITKAFYLFEHYKEMEQYADNKYCFQVYKYKYKGNILQFVHLITKIQKIWRGYKSRKTFKNIIYR